MTELLAIPPAVNLLPLTPERAAALAEGGVPPGLDAAEIAGLNPILREVASALRDLYARTGAIAPWIGYLARETATGRLVGTGSFKDRPREGEAEIAYFTFPGHENRGMATAIARALVEIAWREGARSLLAHTLPEENASARLLRRLGFASLGVVEDPEDGTVWRWRIGSPERGGAI